MANPNRDSLVLSIGDMLVRVDSESQEFMAQTEDRYANFISTEAAPFLRIEVNILSKEVDCNLAPDAERPEVRFDNVGERGTFAWHGLYGEFDLVSRKARMSCNPNPGGFNSFLRFVYSLILLKEQGFLVHASGLIKNGKGYVFPGKSGAGKTTITQLGPDGAKLASDDISLVKIGNGPFIFGTPFWGGLAVAGENTSAPIAGIYFPVKDRENYAKRLKPKQVVERLLPNVVFFFKNNEFSKQLFNLCFDFATKIPGYELHFLPNPSFWECIDAG